MSLRYTLHLLQPDGSYLAIAHGDGPGDDLDTPALPDAITQALRVLYGDGWWLSAMWSGGWRVLLDDPEPHPAQVALFGVGS